METYIQSKGQYETNINGNVIDNSKWNVVYDGDIMNLEVNHNDEQLYMKLDNEDIMNGGEFQKGITGWDNTTSNDFSLIK